MVVTEVPKRVFVTVKDHVITLFQPSATTNNTAIVRIWVCFSKDSRVTLYSTIYGLVDHFLSSATGTVGRGIVGKNTLKLKLANVIWRFGASANNTNPLACIKLF